MATIKRVVLDSQNYLLIPTDIKGDTELQYSPGPGAKAKGGGATVEALQRQVAALSAQVKAQQEQLANYVDTMRHLTHRLAELSSQPPPVPGPPSGPLQPQPGLPLQWGTGPPSGHPVAPPSSAAVSRATPQPKPSQGSSAQPHERRLSLNGDGKAAPHHPVAPALRAPGNASRRSRSVPARATATQAGPPARERTSSPPRRSASPACRGAPTP
eukprot:EG_transcript_28381